MTAVALVALLATAAAPQTWNFKTGSHPVVTVDNRGGAVVVERTNVERVEVEARIDHTPSSCTRYEVQVTNRNGHVDAKTTCSPCEPSVTNCASDFKVNMILRVPKNARLFVQNDPVPAAKI
ncbi:MAG: hypothetical protein ACJ790_15425 [Myxococcaceae bacterium]